MFSKLGRRGLQNCAGYVPCVNPAEIRHFRNTSPIESSASSSCFNSKLVRISGYSVSAIRALPIKLVGCSGVSLNTRLMVWCSKSGRMAFDSWVRSGNPVSGELTHSLINISFFNRLDKFVQYCCTACHKRSQVQTQFSASVGRVLPGCRCVRGYKSPV